MLPAEGSVADRVTLYEEQQEIARKRAMLAAAPQYTAAPTVRQVLQGASMPPPPYTPAPYTPPSGGGFFDRLGGAVSGAVGGLGNLAGRIFPQRQYDTRLGPNQPLNLFNPRSYGPIPGQPSGITAPAQAIIPYAQRGTQTAMGTYQVPLQPLGASLGTTEQTTAGMEPWQRLLYETATNPVNVLMPELGAQMAAGQIAGGPIAEKLGIPRKYGEMGGALLGPLAIGAVESAGKKLIGELPRYMKKQATFGYPEEQLMSRTVAQAAEEAPKAAEVMASKVASDLRGVASTPDEIIGQVSGIPKGEKPGRTVIRLYEGGIQKDLMQTDQEIAGVAKLQGGTGIRNVPKLSRSDASAAVFDAMDYEGPIEEAIIKFKLTPKQAAYVRAAKVVVDNETARMLEFDPAFNIREFYWQHEWIPKRTVVTGGAGKVGGKASFTKARQLQGSTTEIIAQREADIAAAVAEGKKAPRALDAYTWNPTEVLQRRLYKGILYRRAQGIASQLKQMGLAKRSTEFEGDIVDWRTPKGFAPFESKPVPGNPDAYTAPYLVPNTVADMIEDSFGKSWFSGNLPAKVLRDLTAELKFAKTFGGLFQDFDYSMRAVASATKNRDVRMLGTPFRALARAYIPGVNARWTALEAAGKGASNARRLALVEQGINTQAGLGFMGREYQALGKDLFLFKIPVIGRALKNFGSATFQNAHREFLLDIGEKRIVALEGQGLGRTEAAARTALEMNETFSALPAWQSVFRDPTARDALRSTFFSFLEQESWARMPLRQKAFLLSIIADVVVMENMASLAFSGKLLPSEAYIPFNKDGSFNVRFLRAEVGEGPDGRKLYLDLLGQADTTLRLASMVTPIIAGEMQGKVKGPSPAVLESRLNVLPGTALQTYGGKTWFGGEPTRGTPQQFGKFMANQLAPIPVTSVTSEQARIGKSAALAQIGGINISAERLADLRNRMAEADSQFGKPYDELDRQGRLDYKAKYPGHFATSEEMPTGSAMQRSLQLSGEKVGHIKEIGDQFNIDHDGQAYIDARSQILTDAATRQDEINQDSDYKPKTDQDKAVQEWNQMIVDAKAKTPGNVLSGMAFGELERQAEQQMGTQKWALVEQSRMASADPVEKQYLTDRSALEDYWQIEDNLWQKLVVDNPKALAKLKTFPTYRDYVADAQARAEAKNLSPAYAYTDPVAKEFEKRMTAYSQAYLLHTPDVDALRVIWGYAQGVHSKPAYDIYYQRTGLRPRVIVPD